MEFEIIQSQSIFLYLIVGNDDHDDGRPHLDDLVQGLHVGGGPVVSQLELLGVPYSHP